MKVHNFSEVASKYDAIIFDIWGVVYEGEAPYLGAIDSINSLISQNKPIIFLSNSPRPSELAKQKFKSWGVNDIEKITFFTSGDMLREHLMMQVLYNSYGNKIYHLGAEKNEDILSGIDANLCENIADCNFILLSTFLDEGDDLNQYDHLLEQAIKKDIPLICANPDVTIYYKNKTRYCAGYFANRYEKFGGKALYYGKPNIEIYSLVKNRFLDAIDKSKILMVGDTIDTDILGSSSFGIDSALLLTGNGRVFADQLKSNGSFSFNHCKAKPTWISYGISL